MKPKLSIKHRLLAAAVVPCTVFGIFFAGCVQSNGSSSAWTVKVGDKIPDFSLKDTEGNVYSSQSLLGKPYAIAVFATWCPPCKEELKALEKQVWQPLQEKETQILGINFGEEDAVTIGDFKSKMGISFPLLVDEAGTYRKTLGVNMIPQSLVVDSKGIISELHEGYTEDSIKSIGEHLLKDSAASAD